MAITFHCEHCGKKIEAPDSGGGRRGKCPACHNRVYIPSPQTDDDDLHLAPIDDQEETQRRKMMAETLNLTQQLLDENNVPDMPSEDAPPPRTAVGAMSLLGKEENDPAQPIVHYLHLMADGKLDQAAKLEKTIAGLGQRANQILEKIGAREH